MILESRNKIEGGGAFLEISKQQLFQKEVEYKALYGVFFFSKLKLYNL